MAKKSFMNADNPAMQFISAPSPMPPEEEPAKASPAEKPEAEAKPVEKVPENKPKPKSQASKADAFDIAPKSAEHKTKRAQLLMTPSLHEKVVEKAASLNMSFNELVNILLEKYVQ